MSKLEELITYIASKREITSEEELYTILFMADMESYKQLGSSITGSKYVKTTNGVAIAE